PRQGCRDRVRPGVAVQRRPGRRVGGSRVMGLADFFRVSPEVAAQDARMRELREVEKTKRKAERERREAERMAEKVRKQRERQAAREQRDAYLQELKDYVVAHESELVIVYEGIHVFPDVIMRIPMFTWTSSNSMLGEP